MIRKMNEASPSVIPDDCHAASCTTTMFISGSKADAVRNTSGLGLVGAICRKVHQSIAKLS